MKIASLALPAGAVPTSAGDGRHVVLVGPTSVEAWDVWSGTRTRLANLSRARVRAYRGVVVILGAKTARFAVATAAAA